AFLQDRAEAARHLTDPPCLPEFSADARPDPISRHACAGSLDRRVSTTDRRLVRRPAPTGQGGREKSTSSQSPEWLFKSKLDELYAAGAHESLATGCQADRVSASDVIREAIDVWLKNYEADAR